ncbi:hypothetical protein COLO4_38171 [Corchorus olitorius]|uniref:Uncharacterized protein n=1 Tax=Corchorus olitorius TaxID=93759 RepID=A0A1R3FWI8_9ROSI|nr:hypothetical protein COLO4_38171 [Corchorus olitorius]
MGFVESLAKPVGNLEDYAEKGNDQLINVGVHAERNFVRKDLEVLELPTKTNDQFLDVIEEIVPETNLELIGPNFDKSQLVDLGNQRDEQVNYELAGPICSNGLEDSPNVELNDEIVVNSLDNKTENTHPCFAMDVHLDEAPWKLDMFLIE